MQIWKHFKTITRHRILVMQGCFKVGLSRQGLMHDLSKYLPVEFLNGAKYYQGFRSPNNAEREDKGYSEAWLHHKGRNRHHFEYWLDFYGDAGNGKKARVVPCRMPDRYIVEMFMDRVAASKNYLGKKYTDASPYEYYRNGDISRYLHPHTKVLLERLLIMNARYGEDRTCRYIRTKVLHQYRKKRGSRK